MKTLIIPAIDLLCGQAVRLTKGDYNQKTVYSDNPADLALRFQNMGAGYLHIVDLDGAKEGSATNLQTIRKIRRAVQIPMQVGGGIRTAETAKLYLEELNVNRVILGTIAVKNPCFVKEMIIRYGAERVAVGVDVRNGFVSTSGWLSNSNVPYLDFIEALKQIGVKYIITTDISKDGTLTGPNWEMYRQINGINVVVSGGVSCDNDIKSAKDYYGVIVGKAYYEGKVNLERLLQDQSPVTKRIIPCLDIKNDRVVKGINFEELKDIGDPVETAKKYEAQGADEIVLLDICATVENRQTFFDLLKKVSQEISIPIAIGGGIKTIEDFRKAIAHGASKVSVNSAAVLNPELIRLASKEFGSQKVTIAIDGKFVDGSPKVFISGGQKNTGLDLVRWAKQCEELGAGEILLTSMDADGVQTGYDLEMTKAVVNAVNIPVIASGGCGNIDDIITVFEQTNCNAALIASLVHFNKATISEIKTELERSNISCKK